MDDKYDIQCTGLTRALRILVAQFERQNPGIGMFRATTHEGSIVTIRIASQKKRERLAKRREKKVKKE